MKHLFAVLGTLLSLSLFPLTGCNETASATDSTTSAAAATKPPFPLSEQFKQYWYAGKAELTSYKLKQARYGQIHDGTAVLVFVTEDFSKSKQVKLDRPGQAGNDRLPVLKLNLTKKFVTGIYPYSMLMSVFSPVDINNYPNAVKTSATVQEWCGSTYSQVNNRDNKLEVQWNSYFEDEGDKRTSFPECILEDELWTLIRIAPDRLPQGEHKLLPGNLYTRMTHIPLSVQDATLKLEDEGDHYRYTISYTQQQHTIAISFEKNFPYRILGWTESFPQFNGKLLETTAVMDKTIMTDYWAHHNNDDRPLRKELDLPMDSQ